MSDDRGALRHGGIGFLGVGVALPSHVRDNSYWADKLRARDESQRKRDVLAVERTASAATGDDLFRGAKLRHVIDDDMDVSELEAQAGARAIAAAGIDPQSIDLVLVHSLLPDRLIPSNAPAVQDRLGLTRAAAWSLDVGCASLQAHLVTAAALVRARTFRRVLVVQSHAGTRSVDHSSPQSTNFGDAATAAVVGAVPDGYGLLGHYARTDGSFRDGIVLAPVVDGVPVREWWQATGAAPTLASFDTDAGKLAGIRAGEFCREACFGALEDAGIALGDVSLYIGNQSLGWFVDACRRSLALPVDKTFHTFGEHANVGDCAILLNLHEAASRGILSDGDVLLLYSPSAGFTRTAVVYRWHASTA